MGVKKKGKKQILRCVQTLSCFQCWRHLFCFFFSPKMCDTVISQAFFCEFFSSCCFFEQFCFGLFSFFFFATFSNFPPSPSSSLPFLVLPAFLGVFSFFFYCLCLPISHHPSFNQRCARLRGSFYFVFSVFHSDRTKCGSHNSIFLFFFFCLVPFST